VSGQEVEIVDLIITIETKKLFIAACVSDGCYKFAVQNQFKATPPGAQKDRKDLGLKKFLVKVSSRKRQQRIYRA